MIGRIGRLIGYFQTREAMRAHISKLEFELSRSTAEVKTLSTKLAQANAKTEELNATNSDLQVQLDNASQQIKELKEASHESLSTDEIRILELLEKAVRPMPTDTIQQRLKLSRAEAMSCIHRLYSEGYIREHMGPGLVYRLDDRGATWLLKYRKTKS